MALPKQVEQDIKDIEEFEKQLAAQNEPPKEDKKETVSEVVEDLNPDDKPKAEETPTEPTVAEVSDDFKQKYNTLRGKYDAEVPRLHQQVKELVATVDSLQAKLESANETPEVPKERVSLVTDEDREEFGEELLDVTRKVAQEVAGEYEAKLDAANKEINSLKEQLSNTGSQISEMSFDQQLGRAIPDFESVNASPEWAAWLNEYDPILRGPRRLAAQEAFNTGNVEAISDYVTMFKGETQQQEADAKVQKRQKELDSQVTPERNVNNAAPVSTEKRTYTKAQAQQVWDDVQQTLKLGDYDKAQKLEAQITQAYLEGRVEQ